MRRSESTVITGPLPDALILRPVRMPILFSLHQSGKLNTSLSSGSGGKSKSSGTCARDCRRCRSDLLLSVFCLSRERRARASAPFRLRGGKSLSSLTDEGAHTAHLAGADLYAVGCLGSPSAIHPGPLTSRASKTTGPQPYDSCAAPRWMRGATVGARITGSRPYFVEIVANAARHSSRDCQGFTSPTLSRVSTT